MKLKEIKPGMVIHCKNLEERNMLYDELCRIGNMTDHFRDSRENFVNATLDYVIDDLKGRTWSFCEYTATHEFSDLIINDELSALEVLKICNEICMTSSCVKDCPMYGNCYTDADSDFKRVVEICEQWKSDQENKVPEIEWVWEVTTNFGNKFLYFSEEQTIKECEDIVKKSPDTECTYKRVCRVKAV